MVEQTPSRPTPDVTQADKSTPAKLHETLQEKLNELKGTPVTPQAIMKNYLVKTKDRLDNLEESIISVTETQNKQVVYFQQIMQKLEALESKDTGNFIEKTVNERLESSVSDMQREETARLINELATRTLEVNMAEEKIKKITDSYRQQR